MKRPKRVHSKRHRDECRDDDEGDDRHRYAEEVAAADEIEPGDAGRRILHVDLKQPGAARAIGHEPHGERREDRRDIGVGDQDAVGEADRQCKQRAK